MMTTPTLDSSDDPLLGPFLERWYERRALGLPPAPDEVPDDPALRSAYEAGIAGHVAIEAALGGSSAPLPPLGVPKRFERLEYHAHGGMGVVFKAWDAELGREVAYKVIKPELAGVREKVAAFLHEAHVTASLQHSGVVPVHALIEDKVGRPAYAMKFITGRSLKEIVAEWHAPGALPSSRGQWRYLIALFVAACRTVQHAHSQGILHCDLSPRNILIAGDETFVVDWGLATSPDDKAAPGHESDGSDRPPIRAGTASFVAPEVWDESNPRPFSPRSDVYALGALLYLILAGRAPHRGDSPPDIIKQAIAWPPPNPRSIVPHAPRPLAAICVRAMARCPEDRYPTAEAMADDLDAWIAGEKVGADREPWFEAITRWTIHHAVAVATSIVGTVVLASAAVTWTAISQAKVQSREVVLRDRQEALADLASNAFNVARDNIQAGDNVFLNATERDFFNTFIGLIESNDFDRDAVIATLRGYVDRGAKPVESTPAATVPGKTKESLTKVAIALEELVRVDPAKTRNVRWLIDTLIFLGVSESNPKGDDAQHIVALGWLSKARILASPLLGNPADAPFARHSLTTVESSTCGNLLMLKRSTEALIAADRCFELEPNDPMTPSIPTRANILKSAEMEQSHLPWSRPPKVDHAHAIAMADYLAKREGVSDKAVYNAACVFSLASVDQKANVAERERRAAHAVALLERITKAGYFNDPRWRQEFKADADFAPIRGRADFQKMARSFSP